MTIEAKPGCVNYEAVIPDKDPTTAMWERQADETREQDLDLAARLHDRAVALLEMHDALVEAGAVDEAEMPMTYAAAWTAALYLVAGGQMRRFVV